MEMLIVRPLAIAFAHPEYPVDSAEGSRYVSLIQGYGVRKYDTRRGSFLEYVGMGPNRAHVMSSLRRRLGEFDVGSAERDVVAAWMDAYDLVSTPFQGEPSISWSLLGAHSRAQSLTAGIISAVQSCCFMRV